MTTASLHYHFRGKAELGQALIARYSQRFGEALERIDVEAPDARAKLEAYASLYAGVLEGKRMCMCGVLAAEYQTLPRPMRRTVIEFFDDNQRWLAAVLEQGKTEKSLVFRGLGGRRRAEHPLDARGSDARFPALRRPDQIQRHREPAHLGPGEMSGRVGPRPPLATPAGNQSATAGS